MLNWIKEGNHWPSNSDVVPDHPQLSATLAFDHCATDFPTGILWKGSSAVVGDGQYELLPGTYEYRHRGYEGDNRVKGHNCLLRLNRGEATEPSVEMPYGEPFIFRFHSYHGRVLYDARYYPTDCGGSADNSALYRIGD